MIETTLDRICDGEKVIIKRINLAPNSRSRLLEMGVCEENEIEYMFSSPFSSPTAYRVNETTIAIRKVDAENIIVERRSRLGE